ncbi:hypothetical protein M0D46_18730 [Xanthomonas prunicola]|uniref:hypothetical protein n=1 Tax=Xanthomonas prunicola TaxID=2053930 RepID=UPI0021B25B5B|nr:hypothetical protein [Xanthomonas prunicola]UXA69042.1 hypothetical protein M0D46_18730 [Xanthomonas prunicola]
MTEVIAPFQVHAAQAELDDLANRHHAEFSGFMPLQSTKPRSVGFSQRDGEREKVSAIREEGSDLAPCCPVCLEGVGT